MIASLLGIVMLFLLRLQNPGLGAHPRRFVSDAPLALDALTTEVRTFERTVIVRCASKRSPGDPQTFQSPLFETSSASVYPLRATQASA
jgi:hypothetical protein